MEKIELEFPAEFLNIIRGAAKQIGVDLPTFIANRLIRQAAWEGTLYEIMGDAAPAAFVEFVRDHEGNFITGVALFSHLQDEYRTAIRKAMVPGEQSEPVTIQ